MITITPNFYIFSGLPGTGKTTLAKMLAGSKHAVYIRIDTIEQGLRDLCSLNVQEEGYLLAHKIAHDNLIIGINAIADSVNPWTLTRKKYQDVAKNSNARAIDIEIICSNKIEHRNRIENRNADIANLCLPTWNEVIYRDYQPWATERIVIDTAGISISDAFAKLLVSLH